MVVGVVPGGTGKKGIAGGAVQISGIEELVSTLQTLDTKVARSAMGSGIGAGISVMTRAMRKEVTATPVGTEHEASLKAGARKAIKSRFLKGGLDRLGRQHKTVAIIGFGVARKRGNAERLSKGTTDRPGRHGVAQATVHWFVLGTPKRAPTTMPAFFDDVAERAAASSGEQATQVALQKAKQRFEILAARAIAKWLNVPL